MSSTESSGTPAEGSATPPAPAAEFPSFGTTRGSGLARGKRPSATAASSATAAPSDYKPTAIEVVNAPREYTNPFAPADAPAPEPAPAPAAIETPKAETSTPPAPVARFEETPTTPAQEVPAELNILPPAEQRSTPAQTWESEGFAPARESRREFAASEAPAAEVDIASIPPQFLYVRPGVTFVPTPRNWGGAPRERRPAPDAGSVAPRPDSVAPRAPRAEAPAPAKSGGFLGWLKGLFGGDSTPAEPVAAADSGERREGGRRRSRGGGGGRSRGGEGGGQRRHRGGRGRRPYGGEEGTRNSGSL